MLKFIFKLSNAIHIFLYRLTRGRLGSEMRGFQVVLLTTVGRKTGKQRITPLGYFKYDGGYVITASNAGLPKNPGWYYNLTSNSQVTIQVRDQVLIAQAETAQGEFRTQLWEKLILEAPA